MVCVCLCIDVMETSSRWEREARRWRGMKEAFIKLTERRLVQCPHLTVTTIDKLVNGTLTCNTFTLIKLMIIYIKRGREKGRERIREEVKVYQQNSGAKTTLDMANLPRQIK